MLKPSFLDLRRFYLVFAWDVDRNTNFKHVKVVEKLVDSLLWRIITKVCICCVYNNFAAFHIVFLALLYFLSIDFKIHVFATDFGSTLRNISCKLLNLIDIRWIRIALVVQFFDLMFQFRKFIAMFQGFDTDFKILLLFVWQIHRAHILDFFTFVSQLLGW